MIALGVVNMAWWVLHTVACGLIYNRLSPHWVIPLNPRWVIPQEKAVPEPEIGQRVL